MMGLADGDDDADLFGQFLEDPAGPEEIDTNAASGAG